MQPVCRRSNKRAFNDFSRALIRRATVAVSTPIRTAAAENCSARATPRKKRMSSQSNVDNAAYPNEKDIWSQHGPSKRLTAACRELNGRHRSGSKSTSLAKRIQVSPRLLNALDHRERRLLRSHARQ